METVDGIFFAEFDNEMGPKLTFQSPEGLVSSEVFDAISECIIPKPHLFGRMVSTHAFGKTYLGLPICIDGPQYERNRMLFNVGFVLHPSRRAHSAEIAVFEPVTRKIARTLETLEAETDFLSNSELKKKLGPVLEHILQGLQDKQNAIVPIDEANVLHVVVLPRQTSQPVPPVHEHDVPVPVCDVKQVMSRDSDLVMQRILPHIDGVRFVQQIADAADVDTELAIRAVQRLVCLGHVHLVDIFQYSNIYTATSHVGDIIKNEKLREACIAFITEPGHRRDLKTRDLFSLYATLRPGVRFTDFCFQKEQKLVGISKRRFVIFGLVNGLIRRVQPYPVYIPLPGESTLSNLITADQQPELGTRLTTLELGMMNGRKSLDEICCIVKRIPAEMDKAVAIHPRCILVYK